MSFRNYYDTSTYGRTRSDTARANANHSTADRPTAVTAKYITPNSSFKSSSIPILSRDRSSTRENETPISTIANRYANYNKTNKDEKPATKYSEKKESFKLSVPTPTINRSRDVSPVSVSSKYSLIRTARHSSPERRRIKSTNSLPKGINRDTSPVDKEKNIPNKTDKSSGYNSLSSYKLYPRTTSYNRPTSRAETKPEITVNRYAIANRLSNSTNYLKIPSIEKPRTSVSPINHTDITKIELEKNDVPNDVLSNNTTEKNEEMLTGIKETKIVNGKCNDSDDETETVTVTTRHTSPTPPGSSVYVRTRRADMAKTVEKVIIRPKKRPQMVDKELQSDRLDDPTKTSRFGSTTRASASNWSSYTPSINNYTGYAGRYSTQYGNLRDHNSSSCSERHNIRNTESLGKEISNSNKQANSRINDNIENESTSNENKTSDSHTGNDEKENDESEIIINVNLKLKKASSSSIAETVCPEVTITNSQLPPQAPKVDTLVKSKKIKVRKSSTDSLSDSSKKKVIKRRSKSMSSTESDQGSDVPSNEKVKEKTSDSDLMELQKKSSLRNSHKTPVKLKHSKISQSSRESDSPESSVTLSTQSSISEDENLNKSKTNDDSRTSADEPSISLDKPSKQSSPQRGDTGPEEAKSFLIRALAPVTNLFKIRHHDSESNKLLETTNSESTSKDVSNLVTESSQSSKVKNNTDNIIASNDDDVVKLKGIRHIESEERAWWLNSNSESKEESSSNKLKSTSEKNNPRRIRHIDSGERAWWLDSNGNCKKENQMQNSESIDNFSKSSGKCKFMNLDNEEKPWWLDSNANIPEGIERLTPPRKTSSESEKSEKYDFYKVRHIESGEKDWWLSSESTSNNAKEGRLGTTLSKLGSDQRSFPLRPIMHIESGERPWWLSSSKNIPEGIEKLPTPPPQEDSNSSESEEFEVYVPPAHKIPPFPLNLPDDEPLGDRKSPEGLETPRNIEDYRGRNSPYENKHQYRRISNHLGYHRPSEKFISRYTDIDDILGTSGQIYSPFMDSILARRTGQTQYDDSECEEIDPTQVRIHDSTPQRPVIKKLRGRNEVADYCEGHELDDAALQVFKEGDYGPYLDLDSTLAEQEEDLEGLQDNRKNSLILRTQLPVRVHMIIERLTHSKGRELRRALFNLKQILQSDKDLVHEFVANNGLECLVHLVDSSNSNYLDYILRALGQILLYVDGMHGVMEDKHCVKWLYSLLSSQFSHVIKTSLKLLLVFVEYTEKNCLLLIDAIHLYDKSINKTPWHNIMQILQRSGPSDTDLVIYATTLINRCLNNVPDLDVYYDQVDALQQQGINETIQKYMTKPGTDLDLLRQLQIFEAVLLYEDGDEKAKNCMPLDESIMDAIRRRHLNLKTTDRRKSKKFQSNDNEKSNGKRIVDSEIIVKKGINQTCCVNKNEKIDKDLTTSMRRRRDRFARQAHYMIQQQEMHEKSNNVYSDLRMNLREKCENRNINNENHNEYAKESKDEIKRNVESIKVPDVFVNGNQKYTAGLKQRIQNGTLGHSVNAIDTITVMKQKQLENDSDVINNRNIVFNKENSIKDLANKLTTISASPDSEGKAPSKLGDIAGMISKAKEELSKSQSKETLKSPISEQPPKTQLTENDAHWEELKKQCMNREFRLCDLDFSDLRQDPDDDLAQPATNGGVPPPPPPAFFPSAGAPPPPPSTFPFPKNNIPVPPPKFNLSSERSIDSDNSTLKKNKKTIKLFWREVQDNPLPPPLRTKMNTLIWDELPSVELDTKILEHLFESRTNDLIIKKTVEQKRHVFLDTKRSNAINIAMKKLPPPQCIKNAILKMDATAIGREGIEKLFSLSPTEEEKVKINDFQSSNPGLPLGSAEQFLMTLASISELNARLKLWMFKLDFDNLEKEIAEPLMDLKQSVEILKSNKTFKIVLSTLRSVGSFLNGNQVKGFRLEYLSKVVEVKDTVHKHPLLYHVCDLIIEKFPDTSDLFSELGPVIRSSKIDFDTLQSNLIKLESDCKSSWDHLKKIVKHDGSQIFKTKIPEFLTNAAERIILLGIIKNRVMARYNKFLLYVGVPPTDLDKSKPSEFLKNIAEFALEYRTARERTLNQLEKKANHRERNKTRGKMIIDVGNYSSKSAEKTADSALTELLKTNSDTIGTAEGRKKAIRRIFINDDESGDDEIIETLVRGSTAAASSKRRVAPRERKNRISNRQNFNRTLDGSQSWPAQEGGPNSNANNYK